MDAKEKVLNLLSKINNKEVTSQVWNDASDYAKKDLKRKAFLIVDEVISALNNLGNELCDKQGNDSYNARCLNHDKKAFYKDVRESIGNFNPQT